MLNSQWRMAVGLVAAFMLMAVVAAAFEPGPDCARDGDCEEGESCHFWEGPGAAPSAGATGTCEDEHFEASCETDEECGETLVCKSSVCLPADVAVANASAKPAEESDTDETAGPDEGGCSVRAPGRHGSSVLWLLSLVAVGTAMIRRTCEGSRSRSE